MLLYDINSTAPTLASASTKQPYFQGRASRGRGGRPLFTPPCSTYSLPEKILCFGGFLIPRPVALDAEPNDLQGFRVIEVGSLNFAARAALGAVRGSDEGSVANGPPDGPGGVIHHLPASDVPCSPCAVDFELPRTIGGCPLLLIIAVAGLAITREFPGR